MRAAGGRFFIAPIAGLLLTATVASAQLPVCPELGAQEQAIVVCRPFSLYPAARFLSEFTVDHLFKPAPPTFQRSVRDSVDLFASQDIKACPGLATFLDKIPPLRFTQLDRITGTVLDNLEEVEHEFTGTLDALDGKPRIEVRMPAFVQGGYWRGPDVLQVAFWEHKRIGVHVTWSDGRTAGGDVACVSLSPEGLLVRLAPEPSTPLLVLYRECVQ